MSKTTLKGKTSQANSAGVSIADPNATIALIGEQGRESTRPSNQEPIDSREEAIRALAHSKWEAAGSPTGDGAEFWLDAEREVDAERSRASAAQG